MFGLKKSIKSWLTQILCFAIVFSSCMRTKNLICPNFFSEKHCLMGQSHAIFKTTVANFCFDAIKNFTKMPQKTCTIIL
jgi:hypothetical protein